MPHVYPRRETEDMADRNFDCSKHRFAGKILSDVKGFTNYFSLNLSSSKAPFLIENFTI